MMKMAKIKPIFKKGDKQNVQNYRPMSILYGFSKILGTLIHNRLLSFINKESTLANVQHGFRENKSTDTATHAFIESAKNL